MNYYIVKQIVYKRYTDEIVGEYDGYLCVESKKELEEIIDKIRTSNPEYDVHFISISCTSEEYETNKDKSMFFNDLSLNILQ